MAFADESGAYLPGSPGQAIAVMGNSFAALKSIPPGWEAISNMTVSGLSRLKISLVKITDGMVLKIKSKFPMYLREVFKSRASSAVSAACARS